MGGKAIATRPDDEVRERFDRFAEDYGYDNSQATRKLVDEGLRAFGYHPNVNGLGSSIRSGIEAAGVALVLFALGTFGFGALAPASISGVTNPFSFMMLAAGGGLLFIASVWQASVENRLPGVRQVRRLGG